MGREEEEEEEESRYKEKEKGRGNENENNDEVALFWQQHFNSNNNNSRGSSDGDDDCEQQRDQGTSTSDAATCRDNAAPGRHEKDRYAAKTDDCGGSTGLAGDGGGGVASAGNNKNGTRSASGGKIDDDGGIKYSSTIGTTAGKQEKHAAHSKQQKSREDDDYYEADDRGLEMLKPSRPNTTTTATSCMTPTPNPTTPSRATSTSESYDPTAEIHPQPDQPNNSPQQQQRGPGAYPIAGIGASRRPSGLEEQLSIVIGEGDGGSGREVDEEEGEQLPSSPPEPAEATSNVTLEHSNTDGLAEALPVLSEQFRSSMRMEAQPVYDHQESLEQLQADKEAKEKGYKILVFGLVVVACLVLVLSLSFGLISNDTRKEPNHDVADNHTLAPTLAMPPMENLELLYHELPEKSRESLYNSTSPQYRAWEWLLNHPNVTTYPEWRKKQIFALATFYYSFEGPNWPESFPAYKRWMDVTIPECDWIMSDFEVGFYTREITDIIGNDAYETQDYLPCNPTNGILRTLVVHSLFLPREINPPSMPPQIGLLTSLKLFGIISGQINNVRLADLFVPELIQLPHLSAINYRSIGASGTIPIKQISQMSALRHLSIGGSNTLGGSIPSQIARMTSLENFILDGSQAIGGLLPSEIGLMTNLLGLKVSRNSLSGQIPSELALLTNLRRLALDENMFTGSLPENIWGFPGLERLFLQNLPNLHASIPSSDMNMMTSLTTLDFRGSPHLSGTIPENLCFIEEIQFDCSSILCGCDCQCLDGGSMNGTNENMQNRSLA